ncbi:MAG TPA: serine/threonine-protein kinase [Pirellulales bacterium]|nr:serine/threonine-protein kinase [Pirellulales bacterium]
MALKFLPPGVAESSRRFQLFVSEVRLSRQLAHPNVCRVYDIDEVEGQHFLSMEFIDGEDLKGLLHRIGRLPRDKGLEIAQQLCAGLAAAHEKGVLHRDLKPANVMIDGRGQARITDFGLARLEDSASGVGEIAGTPAYMASRTIVGPWPALRRSLAWFLSWWARFVPSTQNRLERLASSLSSLVLLRSSWAAASAHQPCEEIGKAAMTGILKKSTISRQPHRRWPREILRSTLAKPCRKPKSRRSQGHLWWVRELSRRVAHTLRSQ